MFRTKILVLISAIFLPFVIALPQSITAQPEGYDPVVRIAWNNDGSLLAVGYHSGILEIRNGETGELIFVDDSRSELFDFDWSPDNQRLVLLQFDGEFTAIVIYDVTIQSTNTLLETTYLIRAVRWSPDDQKIAAIYGSLSDSYWSSDDGVNVWELTQRELELVTSSIQPVGTIAWGPDSTSIAISDSWKYGTQIFDVTTDDEIGMLTDHGSFAVEYSPDGTMIASRGNDDELSIYDTESYQELYSFGVIHAGGKIAWSTDNHHIAVAGGLNEDRNLVVYDIQTGQPTFSIVDETITAIDWSPDGTRIAYGMDCEFHIIDVPTPLQSQFPSQMLPIDRVGLLDVDWSPDSKYLALTYADGIDLFNLSTHETTTIYDDTAISDAVFSPDGNQLTVSIGYHDGTVKVLEIPSGTVIYRLESFNNGDRVVDLDWNPDGNYIVGIVNKYYGSLAEHWITDLGCSK